MRLGDYFKNTDILRDGLFEKTMFPASFSRQSICYALDEKTIEKINANVNISAVIAKPSLAEMISEEKGVVLSKLPEASYYILHNRLVSEAKMPLIDRPSIASSAIIAHSAIIGRNVIIEDGVEISEGAYIADNSIIREGTFIGPYAIIGTRGMQHLMVEGKPFSIRFSGGVLIGKSCEVLAQAVIQRPYQPFFTRVGDNTKISVRTSIGHGSSIGSYTMIAGNVTIAGNVRTGDNLWVGPSSVIADGLHIGKNVKILLGSVVVSNLSDGNTVSGNFAMDHAKQLKNYNKLKRMI